MKYEVFQLPRVSDKAFSYATSVTPWLRHPLWAWLGARPALAQHTAAEHAAIKRWATNRRSLAEIGVAEGVSARAIREAMAEDATLYLIDPFHLSRVPAFNFTRRAANRMIANCLRGNVVWVQLFSYDAAATWDTSLDFLMIDGDHTYRAVQRDWDGWSRFVAPGGVVSLHDARIFKGGWTTPEYGPVRLVDRLFRNQKIPGWEVVEEIHSLVVIERQK